MRFDTLIDHYEEQISGEGDPVDNRQRINLSDYALSVVEHDMDAFRDTSEPLDKNNTLSKFLNRIIKNYKDISAASSAQLISLQKAKYLQILGSLPNREDIARLLLEDYKKELAEKRTAFLSIKGSSLNIRLDQEIMEYLLSPEAQANARFYKDQRIGEFLKVLTEEYASQPYVSRERIYYRDTVDTIHAAISGKNMIKLTLYSFTRTEEGALTRKTVYLKPYALLEDSGKLYNYVAGYSSTNVQGPWTPYPVRLTSIYKCKKLSYSGVITGKEKRELAARIEKFGVAYIGSIKDEEKRIIVQLTEEGERLYRRILHQRPMFDKKEEGKWGPNTHCFSCTEFQARVYFFRFGKEARILAPDSLVNEFKELYSSAAKLYDKESE